MKMNNVEVCAIDGEILIVQDSDNGEQQSIAITPEQASLVCEWILGAARDSRPVKNDI